MIKKYIFLIWLLLLSFYHVAVFLFLDTFEEAFIIGYSFMMVAFLTLFIAGLEIFKERPMILKFPVFRYAMTYFVMTLITSSFYMIINFKKIEWMIISLLFLFMVQMIWILLTISSRKYVEHSLKEVKRKRNFLYELKEKMVSAKSMITDDASIKMMDKIIDLITYSDPISNKQSKTVDDELWNSIDQLSSPSDARYFENLKAIESLVEKRNRILKDSKS